MARSFAETAEDAARRFAGRVGELEAGLERARSVAVALEQENAALATALDALAHEYVDDPAEPEECRVCCSEPDHVQHRTPAWVRREYGFGV